MVLEKNGTLNRSLFFGGLFGACFEGLFNNIENFCETTRVHHVLLQITQMLQCLIFQEAPLLLLVRFIIFFLTIVPSKAAFYYFLSYSAIFPDPVFLINVKALM